MQSKERKKVGVQRLKDKQWMGNTDFKSRDHIKSKILPVATNPCQRLEVPAKIFVSEESLIPMENSLNDQPLRQIAGF